MINAAVKAVKNIAFMYVSLFLLKSSHTFIGYGRDHYDNDMITLDKNWVFLYGAKKSPAQFWLSKSVLCN